MQTKDPKRHAFRDMIEEDRGAYVVRYQPADVRSPLAILHLVFAQVPEERSVIAKAMEEELEEWLNRFPVPVAVTGIDSREQVIRISPVPSECHLTGYVRLRDDAIVRRWCLLEERELPPETLEPEHLEMAYSELPFRVREEVLESKRLAFRIKVKRACLTLFLMLGFPLFLQAVMWWGTDLVIPLTVVSFLAGTYKGAGLLGFRRPSRFEKRRAEWLGKRELYFFHCERNPTGFDRLEMENFEREVAQEEEKAKTVLRERATSGRKERSSWIAIPRVSKSRAKQC